MKNLLAHIIEQAKKQPQRIVFPESFDARIQRAAHYLAQHNIVHPILITTPKRKSKKTAAGGHANTAHLETVALDPQSERFRAYVAELIELKKDKGMTEETATKLMQEPDYFGAMMVRRGEVDGMVSGIASHSNDYLRTLFTVIGTKEQFHKVSGVFFMVFKKRLLLFADCSVIINPDAHTLADIALDTAETAQRFGITPRVAMLSFSTRSSGKDPSVDIVREATAIARHRAPNLIIDGELQLDAAIEPKVARTKCPDSPLKGNANILIFPNLNTANIAYKLCERLAKAKAIGPILQGLKKPVNDLSRGCNWHDVVHVAAITACEGIDTRYQLPLHWKN